MLTTTTARRTAAVLMATLVAVLLVATSGSARASEQTTDAGTSHAGQDHHAVRHAAITVQQTPDRPGAHLDLASTPPVAAPAVGAATAPVVDGADDVRPGTTVVSPVGRAPPAL